LPACLLALDGEVDATGPKGKRTIKAADFFKGLFETSLGTHDVLTAVRVPAADAGMRVGFAELARRHGDYAMVGLAAVARQSGKGLSDVRLVYFGVGETPVRTTAPLQDGDTIRIDVGQFLRCNFSERIIEEERNIIRSMEVVDLTHRFGNNEVGLEGVSFSVNRGELVCVMGASGSGKSTLMKVLGGQLQPSQGQVLLNDRPLYENLDLLKGYISYIPQEDAFDEHLTIGENLARRTFPGAI